MNADESFNHFSAYIRVHLRSSVVSKSFFVKQLLHRGARLGAEPVVLAEHLIGDAPVAADQVGGRHARYAVLLTDQAVAVVPDREAELQLFGETPHRRRRGLILRDRYYHEALILICLIQLLHRRHPLAAWRAPGGPESG